VYTPTIWQVKCVTSSRKDEYLFCLWLFKGRISRVTSGDL